MVRWHNRNLDATAPASCHEGAGAHRREGKWQSNGPTVWPMANGAQTTVVFASGTTDAATIERRFFCRTQRKGISTAEALSIAFKTLLTKLSSQPRHPNSPPEATNFTTSALSHETGAGAHRRGGNMGKWLIYWNAGYGENREVIEADNEDDAQAAAYEAWREEAEGNADYGADRLTKELAEEHDLEFDENESEPKAAE